MFSSSNAQLLPGSIDPVTFESDPGTLSVDSLLLNASAIFDAGQPNVVGGPLNDLVIVGGDLTLGGTITLLEDPGFGVGRYTLFTYGGALTNNGPRVFLSGNLLAGAMATLDFSTPGQVAVIVSAVPEPASLLTLAGAAALFLRRRRR